jgi:hypothetical protein
MNSKNRTDFCYPTDKDRAIPNKNRSDSKNRTDFCCSCKPGLISILSFSTILYKDLKPYTPGDSNPRSSVLEADATISAFTYLPIPTSSLLTKLSLSIPSIITIGAFQNYVNYITICEGAVRAMGQID